MFQKMVDNRKRLAVVFAAILLIQWLLCLLFYSGEDKVTFLVFIPILPVVIYAFVRLLHRMIEKNIPRKVMGFFRYLYLIVGIFAIVMLIIQFICDFSESFTPSLGGCMGLVIGVLEEMKNEEK